MQIKILGTRGEIPPSAPHYAKHSGILIDNIMMFDLGEKEFLDYHPQYIFITHLHPDHAFFARHNSDIKEIEKILYLPEQYKNQHGHLFTNAQKFSSYEIIPIPTHHSLRVKSQAYLIKKGQQKILYTGDLIGIDEKYYHLLENSQLIITEASHMRKNGLMKKDEHTGQFYGHTGIPNLIQLFRPFTKHILFMHFGSWFYKNIQNSKKKITELSKKNEITAYVAFDGMTIDSNNL